MPSLYGDNLDAVVSVGEQVTADLGEALYLVMEGQKGDQGERGYSPTITGRQVPGGVIYTISDGSPGSIPTSYFVRDGEDGPLAELDASYDETTKTLTLGTVASSRVVNVANYAALLTSTADRVRVLDMSDSIYGFEGPCEFYKTNLTYDASKHAALVHRTSDGAVMAACPDQVPTPPANAPVCALGDCIASWVRPAVWTGHDSETLTYGSKTMFYPTANTYQPWDAERTYGVGEYFIYSGTVYRAKVQVQGVEPPNTDYYTAYLSKNLIDCSAFVSAVLQGITFPNSRYVLGVEAENIRGSYVGSNYMTEATAQTGLNHGGMVTSQMVEWFAEQKRLFRLRTDDNDQNNQDAISQLRFGDVLFCGNPADEDYDDRLHHIDHVVMVLKTYPDGHVLVAQGGGREDGSDGRSSNFQTASNFGGYVPTCKLSIVDLKGRIGEGKAYRVFARPNYGGLAEAGENVPITVNNDSGDGGQFARVFCIDALHHNEAYTLLLKGDLPDGENYKLSAVLRSGGSTTGLGTIINLGAVDCSNGTAAIPFVFPASFSETANEIALFATAQSEAEAQTFSISEAALVRGIAETGEMTPALTISHDGITTSGLLDALKTQVVDMMPSFESRRGRVAFAGGQTYDFKCVRKATGTRWSIAVIGSGGSGAVRESVNSTATDTSYTTADPVPLYLVF